MQKICARNKRDRLDFWVSIAQLSWSSARLLTKEIWGVTEFDPSMGHHERDPRCPFDPSMGRVQVSQEAGFTLHQLVNRCHVTSLLLHETPPQNDPVDSRGDKPNKLAVDLFSGG